MSAKAEKVGRGPCPQCGGRTGEQVTFRRSAGGLLKYDCDNCDSHGYAEPGGEAFKAWSASMTQRADAPAAAPAPAPAAPRASGGFNLSQLGA